MATNAKNLAEYLNNETTSATADIADGSITSAKLASGAAVANIGTGAITTAKLADDAVTNAKVAANAITTESISDATEVLLDATYVSGDATVTVSSTSSLSVGMNIKMSHKEKNVNTGNIMPLEGTKIVSITNSTTFEMSTTAGQAGSDIPTQFTTGVTTDKLAENVIVPSKDLPLNHSLAPYWEDLQYTGGGNSGYSFITNYGSKIIALNGNNGPSCAARIRGTSGHGDFLIRWVPSYAWGFAGIQAIDVAANPHLGQPGSGLTMSQPAGFTVIQALNNSSNNVRYINYWNGSSASVLVNANSGTNGGIWKMWRIGGVLKINDTNATTTVIASGDTRDYYFVNGAQSPHSCELKEAYRLTRGGA